MTREEKVQEIEALKAKFEEYDNFYVVDAQGLSVDQVNNLRMKCHDAGVEYRVAKNSLIKKALEQIEGTNEDINSALVGPTGVFFSEVANLPGKILADFRKESDLPVLKAASISSDIYEGDDQIAVLSTLKSRDELVAEVIGLLQSPIKNVISGLQGSAGQKIAGLVKSLEERG